MDPDFEDAAFGLAVGAVSRPVRTAQGYSIIQVTDRFTKPILTETEFAERKERLRNLVLQKKRAQARSHFIRSTADALDDRKSTRLNSSHVKISYAVFCLKKKMLNE